MALYKGNDHWAFLEQIEAPMWVDLTLEPNSNNQNVDEEWFRTSHMIHQSSSIELKSLVSVSREEDMITDSGSDNPSSPKSTHSVSRSRGNEYKSKKWRDNGNKSFSKKHHLVKVGPEKLSKPISVSDTRAVHETSEQVPRLEVNKDTRFLEFLKNSLRKSYATRQPSVDSTRMVKETTSDGKDVVKMNQTVKSKAKVANVSRASSFRVDKWRRVDKVKPVYQETAKSKVIPNGRDSSAAVATKGTVTKEEVGGANGLNRAEAAGKENTRGTLWVPKDKTGSSSIRYEKKTMNARPHFR